MIWDKNLERLEKYMDKQMEKQTENKMSREDHINVLRTMAIGRTEKETIEYAIKQIKQAKKWKRKAKIEYRRGFAVGYDMGWEDGKKNVRLERTEEPQTRYDIEKVYDPIEGAERYTFVPKKEPQTEKSCDNCFFYGHCQYYGKTLTWLLGDKNEQTGEKVCKSWKPNGEQMRGEE